MKKRPSDEEKRGKDKAPKRRNIGSSFRVSPEREIPHEEKQVKIEGRRSSIRNQASGERRRSSIRSAPTDDATIFARSAPNILESKDGQKKRIYIIHGDPTKPNKILPGGKWDEDDFEAIETLKRALSKLSDKYEFTFLCNHDTLISDLQELAKEKKVDLVLQFCDEGFMNNAKMELHVVALLEMVGIPYTGTGPVALGMTNDKQVILEIASSIGIPTAKSIYVAKDEMIYKKIKEHGLEYPLFVKPNSTDGSFGITTKSICRNDEDLKEALAMIRQQFFVTCPILVQEFLEGDDLNTAIIGNPPGPHTFLQVTEEDYSEVPEHLPRILGFEAKWDENSPYYRIGTAVSKVDEKTKEFMNECSARLFERVGFRDYARFDWKMDKHGKPRMLEGNPNCGWSYDAHLQRMCALGNISYSQMLDMLIEAAFERLERHATHAKEEKYVDLADVSAFRSSEKQLPATLTSEYKL